MDMVIIKGIIEFAVVCISLCMFGSIMYDKGKRDAYDYFKNRIKPKEYN